MRRFELDGKRFWEVTVEGRRVRLRWGAIDGPVQSYDYSGLDEADAEVYAERQVIAQTQRGYVELAQTTPKPEAITSHLVVERHQRFEWKRENAREFLEITQEGRRVSVRGGKVKDGNVEPDRDKLSGQTCDSVAAASALFDQRCADARYDGGKPIVDEPRAFTAQANEELEAQCLEAPGNPAPWAVYADWLIAHGDPRGEIASLHVAGKTSDARRVLGAQLRELCGGEDGTLELEFRHGFAVHATITVDEDGDPLEDVTREYLASPMARFVDSLRFGLAAHGNANDWGPTLHAVAHSPRGPHVRALRFDNYDYQQSEISWTTFGTFGGWERLPALELVHIKSGAGGKLGDLNLPSLKTLIRESGGLVLSEIEAIVNRAWPRLEHLEIWFGSHNYGAEGTVSAIQPIFEGKNFPALRHLGIVNCEFIDDVIPELARSAILPRLTSLDFSKSVMARAATALLVKEAAAFRHLASIDLDENMLLADEVTQIRAVLDNVVPGEQRERDYDDTDEDEPDRYCAVGE